MTEFSFHFISDSYINYLRQREPHIQENKKGTRPYLVLGVAINGLEYYIPFSSPKFIENETGEITYSAPKIHKNLFHTLSRVNSEGEVEYLGNLLINNMLPAPLTEVDFIDFKELFATDKQYAILLSKQYDIVKNDIEKIVAQALKVYNMRVGVGKLSDLNPYQPLIKNQCCDFQLLELMKSNYEKRQ